MKAAHIRHITYVKPLHRLHMTADDDSTVSSLLSGPETRSLGLNTLGTT